MNLALNFISALLGAGLFSFLQFLIQRRDKISSELGEIKCSAKETELSLCRLQLLNLIQHDGLQHELMLVAEHYFTELNGDWYLTPVFCRWLHEHNFEKPLWFTAERGTN